ncbi:MAG: hypothetical protein IH991_21270, partial [Planctomycetes bacterium]|nr:hypothetical protein [Planctomycetota bacterium]
MAKKLFVGTASYDDVGKILKRMGQGFEYQKLRKYQEVPPTEAIVFMNCGGSSLKGKQLRQFVEAGGTVYASCYQADAVKTAFGNVFSSKDVSKTGTLNADVDDQGLATIVGSQMSLNFDTAWRYLVPASAVGGDLRVYLRSMRRRETTQDRGFFSSLFSNKITNVQDGTPLVLSYETGQGGTLFFTAFHNVVQKSEQEKDLLRFLLFRPLMARDLQRQRAAMQERAAKVEREFTGGLSRQAPEKAFELEYQANWSASISWAGQGKLRVELCDSRGTVVAAEESWTSPLDVAGQINPDGKVRVRCTEFVQSEIPFSLVIATGGATP